MSCSKNIDSLVFFDSHWNVYSQPIWLCVLVFILRPVTIKMSHYSSVGISTKLLAGQRRIICTITSRCTRFISPPGCGAHSASYSGGTARAFCGGKPTSSVKQTTYLRLAPKLITSKTISELSTCFYVLYMNSFSFPSMNVLSMSSHFD